MRPGGRSGVLAAVALLFGAGTAAASIVGRVVAADGQPVVGATVRAYAPETQSEAARRTLAGRARTPVATTIADHDGAFRLDATLPLAGVEARAAGFAPAFAASGGDHPLMLRATRAAPLRTVVTAGGRPLAGALVVWTAGSVIGPIAEVMVRTSEDGSCEVPDPAVWAHQGVILHTDFSARDLSPRALDAHGMEQGAMIHGTVVDEGGHPVAGATVWTGLRQVWPLARSDEHGAFRIEHAPESWTSLTVRLGTRVGVAERSPNPITVILQPGRSISGRVRDESGRPVAGAAVTFGDFRGADAPVLSGPDGTYAMHGVPAGEYGGYAGKPGYASAAVSSHDVARTDVRMAATGHRDFVLKRLKAITGRVLNDAGQPVAGALVALASAGPVLYAPEDPRLRDRTTRTSADGHFTLMPDPMPGGENVPAESQMVVLKEGYAAGRAPLPSAASVPVTMTLSRGVELKGRVTNVDGTPVPGVAISVVEDGAWAGSVQRSDRMLAADHDRAWATSDADGYYAIRVQPAVHHVSFRKGGLAPKVVTGFDGAAGRPLDLVLEPGVSVSGRVLRPGGRGVAAVEVVLARPHVGDLATVTTDADGRFAFAGFAPGPYELRVCDLRYGTTHSRPVEAPVEDLEVRFGASGSVLGRVVDAQTRRPVVAYDVLVEWTAGLGGGDRSKSVSSPTGSFTVSGVPTRLVTVTVHAPGYVPAKSEVTVSAAGDTPELQFALVADRPIRGRVASGDGVGLPTAYVVARDAADVHLRGARCDSEGRFELRGLAAQPITLTAHAPGFAPAIRAVDAAHTAALEIALDRGSTLHGEVLLDGVPLPGATVTLPLRHEPARTATTDEHGRFALDGLADGRYAVTARAPAPQRATITLEDVEVPSRAPVRMVMARRPTANLAGRIVGLESEGVTAVVVTARNENGDRVTTSARSGLTFRMPDAPAGRLRVTAYANTRSHGTRAARTTVITVAPGSSAEAPVEFTSDAIQGLVTRNGEPVPHVYVAFTTPELFRASGRTDAAGRYEALGLEPGRYTVQVSGNDLVFTTERTITVPGSLDIDVGEPQGTPR